MAVKEKTEVSEEPMEAEVEWNTADNELQLLQILCGTRPIGMKRGMRTFFLRKMLTCLIVLTKPFLGISKYFQMACIVEKLAVNLNKEITSKGVWDHLATMYDLNKLVSCMPNIFILFLFFETKCCNK